MADNQLSRITSDGFQELVVPAYDYPPLNHDKQEQRFLIIQPCAGNKMDRATHVRCSMNVQSLQNVGPFIAVKNSRGYRLMQSVIEIDGKALVISTALELFLRHVRRIDEPVTLWIRHICLIEYSKEEQERYWTRKFIDSIYERASEVIDMAVYNEDLLDQKLITTVHDSRYAEWTKEWFGGPETIKLPKVYPIRVGQRVSIDNPIDKFAYVPLDLVTSEIRLLVVKDAQDSSRPIETHLAHVPIKSEFTYHALSYAWGPREPTSNIIVNGQIMTITRSLEQILRDLRFKSGPLVIWIDAICIDQSNIPERNRHLSRMAQVYDTAVTVVSHLGQLSDDTAEALELLQHLQVPVVQFDRDGCIIGNDKRIEANVYHRGCAALYKLLTRPYFRRVWILQEVAYASNPVIGCGNGLNVALYQLERAACNLQDMLGRDPELADEMKAVDPDLVAVSKTKLDFIRKLFYFRNLISKGQVSVSLLSMDAKFGEHSPGFLETAILTRDFEATVGHDKIFSLWNLAQDTHGLEFKMDYTESVPETFTKFTMAWAAQHKSLDIISVAEQLLSSKEFYNVAPAWCPDWTIPSNVSCLVRREVLPRRMTEYLGDLDGKLYSADGNMQNDAFEQPLFIFDEDKLLCTGVIIDRLETLMTVDGHESDQHILPIWEDATHTFYNQFDKCPYEDPQRAVWAMAHGDVLSAWLPREESQYSSDDYKGERYVCEQKLSRHILPFVGGYNRIDAAEALKNVVRGRRFGFTSKGYMCMVPYWVVPEHEEQEPKGPWLLAILATCSVPVLLLPNEDGTFQFAGSCFVQGWMEGEAFGQILDAESPKSFWAAREHHEKLCIR